MPRRLVSGLVQGLSWLSGLLYWHLCSYRCSHLRLHRGSTVTQQGCCQLPIAVILASSLTAPAAKVFLETEVCHSFLTGRAPTSLFYCVCLFVCYFALSFCASIKHFHSSVLHLQESLPFSAPWSLSVPDPAEKSYLSSLYSLHLQ